MHILEIERENPKKFPLLKIIAFESETTKFSKSPKGYLSLAVNVLRNILKIFQITKGDIFQVRFSQSDGKISLKHSHAEYSKSLGPFNMLTVKGCSETVFF